MSYKFLSFSFHNISVLSPSSIFQEALFPFSKIFFLCKIFLQIFPAFLFPLWNRQTEMWRVRKKYSFSLTANATFRIVFGIEIYNLPIL